MPHFQGTGVRFDPWSGELGSHMPRGKKKKKKISKKKKGAVNLVVKEKLPLGFFFLSHFFNVTPCFQCRGHRLDPWLGN